MKKLLISATSAAAAMILMAGSAQAQTYDPNNVCSGNQGGSGWNVIATDTTGSSVDYSYQGYSMQDPKSPEGQGTSGFTITTDGNTYELRRNPGNVDQTCWKQTSEGDGTPTVSDIYGPGNSPAEELLADRIEEALLGD
jgi:hypothetical protein